MSAHEATVVIKDYPGTPRIDTILRCAICDVTLDVAEFDVSLPVPSVVQGEAAGRRQGERWLEHVGEAQQ